MIPIKLTNDTWPPKDGEFCSSIVLYYDNWNDYSYRTSFVMCYCDADGMVREVGNVKIYYWQNDEVRTNQYSEHTKSSLGDHIESLSASYCSLGQELSYYRSKISRNYWLFEPKCRNNAEITYTQRLQIASYFP